MDKVLLPRPNRGREQRQPDQRQVRREEADDRLPQQPAPGPIAAIALLNSLTGS